MANTSEDFGPTISLDGARKLVALLRLAIDRSTRRSDDRELCGDKYSVQQDQRRDDEKGSHFSSLASACAPAR